MNTENMLLVADLIEQNPNQFDMGCINKVVTGTSDIGCIGGFCKGILKQHYISAVGAIEEAFELSYLDSSSLCYGGSIWVKYSKELGLTPCKSYDMELVDLDHVKPSHAVTMLRKLASGEWTFD